MFAVRFSESITLIEFTVMSWLKAAEVVNELKCVKRPRTCRVKVGPCSAPPGEMARRIGDPSSMSMACCNDTTSPSVDVVSVADHREGLEIGHPLRFRRGARGHAVRRRRRV